MPNPAGTGTVRLAGASLGYAGEGGLVIAGSRRLDFPSEGERLLFRVAANQAVVALQGARLYSQVRHAVRAREEFLFIDAHELRNPVASMKGNAELLLRWHALFQPFGRARNAEERQVPGLGLGLYNCRQITERHKGRIWAESDGENRGTTICLWLPAGDGARRAGRVDG